MFKRKIENEFYIWKESLKSKRKALVVKGLRQIGKTTSIKAFAHANYKNIVYLNFKLEPNLKVAFSGSLSVNTLVTNISALRPDIRFVPYETVLIFDEVQECSGARTSIKSFVEDDERFDVIASGSLLGIKGYNNKMRGSSAVGYEHTVYMKPMDFEEFLWAKGIDEGVIKYLKDCFNNHLQVRQPIHETMNNYYKEYLCVGGMPDAVNTFINTNDLNQTRNTLVDILEGYKDDYGSHLNENEDEVVDRGLMSRINKVYNSIPSQLAKENKKFTYSQIEKKGTAKKYDDAIQWLVDYGLLNYCYNLRLLETPFAGNKKDDVFKLYVADTGLFLAMLEKGVYEEVLFGDMKIYKGAIYENVVADAFSKKGISLYYYSKDSGLEVDFIVKYKQKISLIEVKSKSGNAKSSKTLLGNKKDYPLVKQLLKIGEYNIGYLEEESGNIKITIPHYLTFLLAEDI